MNLGCALDFFLPHNCRQSMNPISLTPVRPRGFKPQYHQHLDLKIKDGALKSPFILCVSNSQQYSRQAQGKYLFSYERREKLG